MLRLSFILVAALAPIGRGVAQETAAPPSRPESMLPIGTLVYVGTDDLEALVKRTAASPMGKILAEQEVKDFLAKPLAQARKAIDEGVAMAKQQPQLAGVDLDLDKILAGAYGRAFLAITHFEFGLKENALDPNAIDVGLVIGLEPKAGAVDVLKLVRQVVGQLLASAGPEAPKFESIEANGVTYERLKNPHGSGALCFASFGGMTVMSLSEKAIAGMAANVKAPAGSLTSDPEFTRCVAAVGAPSGGDLVLYAQIGRLLDKVAHLALAGMALHGENEAAPIVAKLLELSKITTIGPSYATAQWRDGTAVTLAYSEVDPSVGGLCALAAKRPVDLGLIKRVPKDALSFSIGSFDLAPVWDTIFGALKEGAPKIHEAAMEKVHEFETMVAGADAQGNPNWDVRRDLLGVLGGRMMSISTPGAGSALGPGADHVFWIETSNPQTLEKSLGYLFALPGQLSGTPINFKEQVYGDAKLEVLDAMSLGPLAMMAGSMQLTWCIQGGRFWFATTTKAMKKALDAEKPPQPDPATGAPPPPREDITAKADFAKRWVAPPKDAVVTAVSYSDTATNFENSYQGLVGLIPMLQMGLQQQGMKDLPFDISLLPTGETIAQHLFGTVEVSYRVGERAHMSQIRGPFGPEMALAVGGLVAAGAGMIAYQQAEKSTTPVERTHKTAKGATDSDPVKQARHDLADISASITVYIITNMKPPEALEDLTKPAADYPKGYTNGQPIPKDPWGHAYAYTTDGKDNYKLWSFGPNGVDDHGEGDDIVAGH